MLKLVMVTRLTLKMMNHPPLDPVPAAVISPLTVMKVMKLMMT